MQKMIKWFRPKANSVDVAKAKVGLSRETKLKLIKIHISEATLKS